jgi:Holliday junction resolvase RusA-like endonuclease
MINIKENIKVLSVNDCWKGKRFKTSQYKAYQNLLLYELPNQELPKPPYKIDFEFGFSSAASDWDNPVKPLQDIMQKKYKFNDKDIIEAKVKKVIVKKGDEYFKVRLESLKEEIELNKEK